jgi:hypothetical protein
MSFPAAQRFSAHETAKPTDTRTDTSRNDTEATQAAKRRKLDFSPRFAHIKFFDFRASDNL